MKNLNKYKIGGFDVMVQQYSRDTALKMNRSKIIGSSDIGSIMGVNPYCSAYKLFLEKIGNINPDFDARTIKKMAIGKMMEDFILSAYLDIYGIDATSIGRDVRIDKEGFTAQADAIVDGVILEIKNIEKFYGGFLEHGELAIPAYYKYQMYWQMYLFGIKQAKLIVFNNSEQQLYALDCEYPAPQVIELMLSKANEFLNALQTGNVDLIKPDLIDDYALMHPKATGLSYIPVKQFYDDLLVLNEQIKELEKQAEEKKNTIKLYMKDSEAIYNEDDKAMVSWKAVTTSRIDSDKLKSEYPDIYNASLKYTTARVFKCNNGK